MEQLSWMCKGCLLQRSLGPTYTKLSVHRVFSRVSMDPLMPISVLPWQGSKEPVKKIPVIVKCLTWGCIYLTVAESQATNQMLLVLLRLEQTFGQLELISRDRGKDLLIDNLNPRILSHEPHSNLVMLPIEKIRDKDPFIRKARESFYITKFNTQKRLPVSEI